MFDCLNIPKPKIENGCTCPCHWNLLVSHAVPFCPTCRGIEKNKQKGGKEMSYSFNPPCGKCTKVTTCADGNAIQGAITIIHTGPSSCHQGSGSVDLNCGNFEEKKEE